MVVGALPPAMVARKMNQWLLRVLWDALQHQIRQAQSAGAAAATCDSDSGVHFGALMVDFIDVHLADAMVQLSHATVLRRSNPLQTAAHNTTNDDSNSSGHNNNRDEGGASPTL